MKYLFLGGNSLGNREWLLDLSNKFENPKIVFEYLHWNEGEDDISFTKELSRLKELEEDKYTVIAKSAGCVLALKVIAEEILDVKECYFIGFPFLYIQRLKIQDEINRYLLKNKKPITFIQKKADYQIGYNDLKSLYNNLGKRYRFILYKQENESQDNHHYANTKYLKDLIV